MDRGDEPLATLQEDHFQAPPGSQDGAAEALESEADSASRPDTGQRKRRGALADLPAEYPPPATRLRLCHLSCLFVVCHQNDPDPGTSCNVQCPGWVCFYICCRCPACLGNCKCCVPCKVGSCQLSHCCWQASRKQSGSFYPEGLSQ